MENRLPTGPGSRGGKWHNPEYRRAYYRCWRRAHPEYNERERLRMSRTRKLRTTERSGDPVDTLATARTFPRPLPLAVARCACGCSCEEVVVNVCGWCRDGEH
jgi:hypothetical protein